MKFLSEKIEFPPIEEANDDGILAIGGDLSSERLLLAYTSGIFPWYDDGLPIWWSPDPRFVLFPEKLKVSKSMRQFMRNTDLKITINQDFDGVISNCSHISRPKQMSTWINDDMIDAYLNLHRLGYAISVEVWEDSQLIGGLYGVDLKNNVFCGESMFAKTSNASKMAFIYLVKNFNYKLIDCQVYTEHLESLGAEEIARQEFLKYL